MSRVSWVVVSMAVSMGLVTPAIGQPAYAQKVRSLAAAQHEYDVAEQAHGVAANLLNKAQRHLQELETLKVTLPADLAKVSEQARVMAAKALDAEKQVPVLKAELAKAETAHVTKLEASRASKAALAEAMKAVQNAEASAMASYESSKPSQDLVAAVVAAETKLDAAIKAVVTSLQKKTDYKALVDAAAAAEAQVKILRESGRTDGLPAASRSWIETKNAVEQTRTQAQNADPAVREARQKLAVAKQAQAMARAKFEQGLATVPEVAGAIKAMAASKGAADQDANVAAAADRQVNAIRSSLATTTRSVSTLAQEVRTAESNLEQLKRRQLTIDQDLKVARAEVQRLTQEEAVARANLSSAISFLSTMENAERLARQTQQQPPPAPPKP